MRTSKISFNRKIVITGAGGFLGSNLVYGLVRNNYRVFGLSSNKQLLSVPTISNNIRYYHKDFIFSDEAKLLLKDAILINCAFPRESSGTLVAEGLSYIQRLFVQAKKYGVEAVINISSQSVYSQLRETIADEDTELNLEGSYAVGKYATELMLRSSLEGTKIPFTNLRLASLIGPGFNKRIVNKFVKQALKEQKVYVARNNRRFGFMDIDDAVSAIISLVQTKTSSWKSIYNVGSGVQYSLEEIAEAVKRVFKQRNLFTINIIHDEGNGNGKTGVSYMRLYQDTGFRPSVSLEKSIDKILEDFLFVENMNR